MPVRKNAGLRADFEAVKSTLDVIGRVFFIGQKPGSAQTMKLANNLLSETAGVATYEAVVMGVKSGLDPNVMIDVINAGSGMNTASLTARSCRAPSISVLP